MRWALSWIFYALGCALCVVFDRWTSHGMIEPVYAAYSSLMTLSVRAQGEGPGPWTTVERV